MAQRALPGGKPPCSLVQGMAIFNARSAGASTSGGRAAQELLNGQPHLLVCALGVLLETEPRRLLARVFIAGVVGGAEVQVPEPAGQHAIVIVDEERVPGRIADDLVELIDDRGRERVRR